MEVKFFVPGRPVPQGSKKGFVVRSKAVLVDTNRESLGAWRSSVSLLAAEAAQGKELEGAVQMEARFTLTAPISVKRRWPWVRPDLDKLIRSLLDGITGSGVWHDDAQVVDLHAIKEYGTQPGVHVTVRGMQ